MTERHRTIAPEIEHPSGVVILSRQLEEQLAELARNSYPYECCGILLGDRSLPTIVQEVHPTTNLNTSRARDRYVIDPQEIVRVDREADSQGWDIIGFYHSHPDHPAAPSPVDTEFAWPDYLYLIISVVNGISTQLTAWVFDESERFFLQRSLRPNNAERVCATKLNNLIKEI